MHDHCSCSLIKAIVCEMGRLQRARRLEIGSVYWLWGRGYQERKPGVSSKRLGVLTLLGGVENSLVISSSEYI